MVGLSVMASHGERPTKERWGITVRPHFMDGLYKDGKRVRDLKATGS